MRFVYYTAVAFASIEVAIHLIGVGVQVAKADRRQTAFKTLDVFFHAIVLWALFWRAP